MPALRDWPTILAADQPWPIAYGAVAGAAREALEALPVTAPYLSTASLAALLWPPGEAGAHPTATRRLFKALNALRGHALADCCTMGTPRKLYGRDCTPTLWHRPDPAKRHLVVAQAHHNAATAVRREARALVLVSEIAAIELHGEGGGPRTIQDRLDQLSQIVHDCRAVLDA